ncbi:MAG: pilus assembly PilX N-terminal domain-containing protein, partial [Immundisolibacteraceae bacterium]|nr:pilus assembly PilX N-terminal domain-containing protein [Immundisolibacteraceae bacterium]
MIPVVSNRAIGPVHQTGAVMMVAIVFLLVIVSVMGLTLVTMSGSDVLDSADNANAAEALFVAEAGIERASWQLANGTACTDIAPQGPFDFGTGSFSITTSLTNASVCSVTVTASINNINRTIEADISIGGAGGWAVGAKTSGATTLLSWDGISWAATGPWAGVPDQDLHGVHCTDSSNCWAVGQKSSGALLLRWQGSSWTRDASGSLPNVDLNGVFCIDASDCWAVGNKSSGAVILHWGGSSWAQVSAPSLPNKNMLAVHCVTSNDCWAVGEIAGTT